MSTLEKLKNLGISIFDQSSSLEIAIALLALFVGFFILSKFVSILFRVVVFLLIVAAFFIINNEAYLILTDFLKNSM